jgi:hypothetical protein
VYNNMEYSGTTTHRYHVQLCMLLLKYQIPSSQTQSSLELQVFYFSETGRLSGNKISEKNMIIDVEMKVL